MQIRRDRPTDTRRSTCWPPLTYTVNGFRKYSIVTKQSRCMGRKKSLFQTLDRGIHVVKHSIWGVKRSSVRPAPLSRNRQVHEAVREVGVRDTRLTTPRNIATVRQALLKSFSSGRGVSHQRDCASNSSRMSAFAKTTQPLPEVLNLHRKKLNKRRPYRDGRHWS